MRTAVGVAAALGCVVAAEQAAAALTYLEFTGHGRVTEVRRGQFYEIVAKPNTAVTVRGRIWFSDGSLPGSDPAIADDYSGFVSLYIPRRAPRAGQHQFSFQVHDGAGGVWGGSYGDEPYGSVLLRHGRLMAVYLGMDDAPISSFLGPTQFMSSGSPWSHGYIKGVWRMDIDRPFSPVPDAPVWAMMIIGFGLIGSATRRRSLA